MISTFVNAAMPVALPLPPSLKLTMVGTLTAVVTATEVVGGRRNAHGFPDPKSTLTLAVTVADT